MLSRSLVIVAALAAGCSGELARWTGRSEGTISLTAGMTRADAQRRSTMKLNEFGDNDRFFDFDLAGESIVFHGCTEYALSDSGGRITIASFHSANESWPDLLQEAGRVETELLAHGWKRDPRTRSVASLPARGRQTRITESGAIDAFRFYKGNVSVTITPSGLWGGIPWWRSEKRAKVFWRTITVSLMD